MLLIVVVLIVVYVLLDYACSYHVGLCVYVLWFVAVNVIYVDLCIFMVSDCLFVYVLFTCFM